MDFINPSHLGFINPWIPWITKNPWITPSILDAIQRKHRLAKLARNDINRLQEYRQFRNTLSQTIRLSKSNYFHRKFSACISDSKKTWVEINKIIKGNSSKSRTIKLNDDSGETLPPHEIPDFMNNYFFNVPIDLQSRISHSPNDPLMYISRVQNSFVFLETSADEVECIISSFKSKRSGLFDIPNFIYKRISRVISPIISKLINLSAETGVFPDIFKIAKIVPIFKAGVSTTIKNYRPISILHFISKIFHKRFISFLTKFYIINIHQYGFLKNHSTIDAAIYLTEHIYRSFNSRNDFVSIFLDYSRAFDTVDHNILLNKLDALGIRGNILDWVRSYLKDRNQYVSVNGLSSSSKTVNIGVPQGSILGPLFFLIYINDMHKCMKYLSCIHYADDTSVFIEGRNLTDLLPIINEDLSNIYDWTCMNKLSLNLQKTFYIIFSNKFRGEPIDLHINNTKIASCDFIKFLGITVDSKLSFAHHIENISNKISKSVGVIRKLSNFLPKSILGKIYSSLVHPYLVYGVEIWGHSRCSKIAKLLNIQNRCLKIISTPSLNIMSSDKISQYFSLNKLYQILFLDRLPSIKTSISNNQVSHTHSTRFIQNNRLLCPPANLAIRQYSFSYKTIKLWNAVPLEIRQSNSYFSFKNKLRSFLCA